MQLSFAQRVKHSPLVQRSLRVWTVVSGVDRRRIRKYLGRDGAKKLQVGAGNNLRPDWLNTNWYPINPFASCCIFMDATQSFPLPDSAFDFVYSEHMIEHVNYLGAKTMLAECFRVLKPGGRIRLMTPDMDFLLALLAEEKSEVVHRYIESAGEFFLPAGQPRTAIGVFNHFVRSWGHTFIHDRDSLTHLLGEAGFTEIAFKQIDETDVVEFRDLNNEARMPEGFLRLESMTFEAVKPSGPAL